MLNSICAVTLTEVFKIQNLGGLKREQHYARMCAESLLVKNCDVLNKNISIYNVKMIKYNLLFDALYRFASAKHDVISF